MDLLVDDVVVCLLWDLNIQCLVRVCEIYYFFELCLSVGKGLYFDNLVSGMYDFSFEMVIYSLLLVDSWWLFGGYCFVEGNFEEGKGSCCQLFVGIEWCLCDYWGEFEFFSVNFYDENKFGVCFFVVYDVSDCWQLGGELEWILQQMLLCVLCNGVSVNCGEGWLCWFLNECWEYCFSVVVSWFIDCNCCQEYIFFGKECFW